MDRVWSFRSLAARPAGFAKPPAALAGLFGKGFGGGLKVSKVQSPFLSSCEIGRIWRNMKVVSPVLRHMDERDKGMIFHKTRESSARSSLFNTGQRQITLWLGSKVRLPRKMQIQGNI
jgi:hypothetical protein